LPLDRAPGARHPTSLPGPGPLSVAGILAPSWMVRSEAAQHAVRVIDTPPPLLAAQAVLAVPKQVPPGRGLSATRDRHDEGERVRVPLRDHPPPHYPRSAASPPGSRASAALPLLPGLVQRPGLRANLALMPMRRTHWSGALGS